MRCVTFKIQLATNIKKIFYQSFAKKLAFKYLSKAKLQEEVVLVFFFRGIAFFICFLDCLRALLASSGLLGFETKMTNFRFEFNFI